MIIPFLLATPIAAATSDRVRGVRDKTTAADPRGADVVYSPIFREVIEINDEDRVASSHALPSLFDNADLVVSVQEPGFDENLEDNTVEQDCEIIEPIHFHSVPMQD